MEEPRADFSLMVSNNKLYYKRGSTEYRDGAELNEIVTAAVVARDDEGKTRDGLKIQPSDRQSESWLTISLRRRRRKSSRVLASRRSASMTVKAMIKSEMSADAIKPP